MSDESKQNQREGRSTANRLSPPIISLLPVRRRHFYFVSLLDCFIFDFWTVDGIISNLKQFATDITFFDVDNVNTNLRQYEPGLNITQYKFNNL